MPELPPSTLVLTGFMGTGKTTVGRLVAARLGRPFVDLDEQVAALAGRPVAELFAVGEAEFRWWEQLALGRLDLSQPLVLATGGGTLVGAWNQGRVAEVPVIVLDAPLEAIRARIGAGEGRPLASQSADLYERRAAAYARLPLHVQTAGRSPEAVAEQVIARAAQHRATPAPNDGGETLTVRVPGGSDYPIHVQAGVAAGIGGFVQGFQPSRVALVTDSTVGRLWGETVRHDLLAARLPTTLIEVPAGEAHKTLDSAARVYDGLLAAGVDRDGAVVALGGGVVGDLAGFAAATWMRGTRTLVQVPTTLLAMVDASVGGKTGVDHPGGKNLIGAFRPPDLVLADPLFLGSLPAREWRSGLAEVAKHGLIGDVGLWEELGAWTLRMEKHPTPSPPHPLTPALLARAIRVKVEIVERDPWERGERAKLNLGHTFGHAYEWLSGYALTHGEAVSVGIVTAARLSEAVGLAERGLAAEIETTLRGLGLPTRWPGAADGEQVWQAMQRDKKRAARGLRFVLPRTVGEVVVTEPGAVDPATVVAVIEAQNREVPA